MIQEQSTQTARAAELPIHSRFRIADHDPILIVNDTSFIAWSNEHKCYHCVGVDGTVLGVLKLPNISVNLDFAISEHEVLLSGRDYKTTLFNFVVWNLLTNNYTTVGINLKLENDSYERAGLFYFNASQIICCYLQSKEYEYKLVYFRVSELSSGIPFHEYIFKSPQQHEKKSSTQPYIPKGVDIVKLNEQSMVGFMLRYYNLTEESICVNLYQFNEQKQAGEDKAVTLSFQEVLNLIQPGLFLGKIRDIWVPSANLLYIQVKVSINIFKYFDYNQSSSLNLQKERFHTFYYDLLQDKLSQGPVNLEEPHRFQFINSIRGSLNYKEEQKWTLQKRIAQSLSLADMPDYPGMVSVPIYYVEPQGNIVASSQPIGSEWRQTFHWTGYKSDRMYKVVREKQYRQLIVYQFPAEWYAYSCGLNLVYVNFMTEMIAECCEDLLELVCNLA